MRKAEAINAKTGDIVRLRNTNTYGFIADKLTTELGGALYIDFLVYTENEKEWKGYKQVSAVKNPDGGDAVEETNRWTETSEAAPVPVTVNIIEYTVMGKFEMWLRKKPSTNLCFVEELPTGALLRDPETGADGIAPPSYKDKLTEKADKIAHLINARCREWLKLQDSKKEGSN